MASYSCVTFCIVLALVSAVVQAQVCQRRDRLQAEILDHYKSKQSYESFEAKVHNSIKLTENLFATDSLARIVDVTAGGVDLKTAVKGLEVFLPLMQEGLAIRTEWNLNFAKSVLDSMSESKRASAEILIPLIEGKLEAIVNATKELNETQLSDEDRRAKVHMMDSKLGELVEIFKDDHVMFREYPLLANKALIALGFYIPMFRIYERAVDPELFKSSKLTCHLHETLRQYGYLTTRSRLENLDIPDYSLSAFKFTVWDNCFPEDKSRSNCELMFGPCEVAMTDILRNQSKIYTDLIELANKTCFHHAHFSGSGWLFVEVGLLKGDIESPTLKISVDGVNKFEKARMEVGMDDHQNHLVFQTGKIQNSAKVVVEVSARDESLFSLNLEFANKYYSAEKDGKQFSCSTFWIPERVYHH